MVTGNEGNAIDNPRNEESVNLTIDSGIIKARKESENMEKEFRRKFRDFEPYNFSKIGNIAEKAKNDASKQNKQDIKIKYLSNALEKINNILENENNVYTILLREGDLSEPYDEERQNELAKANNIKQQLEFLIRDLLLEKEEEPNVPYEPIKEEKNVKMSTQESWIFSDNMTVNDVAEYLRRKPSTIYHKKIRGEMPYHDLGGGGYIFKKSEIDDWLKKKPKRQAVIKIDSKRLHYTIENHFLEEITNVFVEKEYIDADSAFLMRDRFSRSPKQEDSKILWKKDLISLLTFVYLADRLEYFERENIENFRSHPKTSSNELKERKYEDSYKEVMYSDFVNNNFIFREEVNLSKVNLSRNWWGINSSVCKLRERMAYNKESEESIRLKEKEYKGNIIIKSKDQIEDKITRKEAIIYYFKKKDNKYFIIDQKMIDHKILEIFNQIWQKLNNKPSKSQSMVR